MWRPRAGFALLPLTTDRGLEASEARHGAARHAAVGSGLPPRAMLQGPCLLGTPGQRRGGAGPCREGRGPGETGGAGRGQGGCGAGLLCIWSHQATEEVK